MKRLLSLLLVASLFLVCTGCGGVYFVGGVFNPGFSTISGSVSIVQLTFVSGPNGTLVQVTFVTFLQVGASSTLGFCGDQRSQFPINQAVRTQFTPGQPCASLVGVVFI